MIQSTIGISAFEQGTKQPFMLKINFLSLTDVSQQNTNSDLSNVCTLSAHVRSGDDLEI